MKLRWCLTVVIGLVSAVVRSEDGNSLVLAAATPWVVAADESEAIQRALADVQRDWYKVLGHRPVVLQEPPASWQGPLAYLGTRGPWLKELAKNLPAGSESFVVRCQRDAAGWPVLIATGLANVAALSAAIEPLLVRVPEDRKSFFQAHLLTPIRIHLHSLTMLESSCEAVLACGEGRKADGIPLTEKSLRAVDDLFAVLRQAETGKWSALFVGERIAGLEASRDQLRVMLASLRGDPNPPTHSTFGYPELDQSQERFATNFPRLYPASNPGAT